METLVVGTHSCADYYLCFTFGRTREINGFTVLRKGISSLGIQRIDGGR